MLCLVGGIIGIVFGKLVSFFVTLILNWPVASSLPAIISAFVVSVTTGVIFGYYPAAKAARMVSSAIMFKVAVLFRLQVLGLLAVRLTV